MNKRYILSSAVLAVFIATVALLRDIFDFKLTISEIASILQHPFTFWFFAVVLFLTGFLLGINIKTKIKNNQKEIVKVFDLSNKDDIKTFYEELYSSYAEAKSEIYLTGTGFITWSESQDRVIQNTFQATEKALKNGVNFVRIQMPSSPCEEWTGGFAKLMENYPKNLRVYADNESVELANTALIDPDGDNPIVQLLFESEEADFEAKRLDMSTALFIYGRSDLAKSLKKQFISRVSDLQQQQLLPNEMRELGLGIYYFAYASNMLYSQMLERCPTAKKIGVGVLYGWNLEFAVDAPHLGGNAAGIYRTQDSYVWGVVYAISKKDKEELDKTEQGGYYPMEVNIKMKDSQEHINKVWSYIPIKPKNLNDKPVSHYVELTLKGAKENNIDELITHLENLKQSL